MPITSDKPFGLVLNGGGAKGAYQIGVWKYLIDHEMINQIGAISGTSIGSLNSMLMAQNDFHRAVHIWENIHQDDIMAKPESGFHPWKNRSLFSQVRIDQIIDQSIEDWDAIIHCPIDLYICVSAFNPHWQTINETKTRVREWVFESEYHLINGKKKEEIMELLLASSAIPGIYPIRSIDGTNYVDGGVIDNCPIRPLVEAGYKKIIVVHLNEANQDEFMKWQKSIYHLNMKDVEVYPVFPSEPITFFDTLVINKVLTLGRMALGYEDAGEQLPF